MSGGFGTRILKMGMQYDYARNIDLHVRVLVYTSGTLTIMRIVMHQYMQTHEYLLK
jgi:hypothetical protein